MGTRNLNLPVLDNLVNKLKHKRSSIFPETNDPFDWKNIPENYHPVARFGATPAPRQSSNFAREDQQKQQQSRSRRNSNHLRPQPSSSKRHSFSSALRSSISLLKATAQPSSSDEGRQSVSIACALPPDYHEHPPEYDFVDADRLRLEGLTTTHHIARRISEPSPSQHQPFDWNAYYRSLPLDSPSPSPVSQGDHPSPDSARLTQPFETFHQRDASSKVGASAPTRRPAPAPVEIPIRAAVYEAAPVSPLNDTDRAYLMRNEIDEVMSLYGMRRH